MASTRRIHLTMLVSSTIWGKRNARVFRNHCAPSFILLDAIKRGARLWAIAGAKYLGQIMAVRVVTLYFIL
jgi:hypothetical protein